MGWIKGKSVWLGCPHFADVFEGREAFEHLQSPPIIVGVDEVVEVCGELGVAVVMVALDHGFLDRPVHPLDLAVGLSNQTFPSGDHPMADTHASPASAGSFNQPIMPHASNLMDPDPRSQPLYQCHRGLRQNG